jgi:hypothetical protein
MRLIKVNAPEGEGENVLKTAFLAGIDDVTTHKGERRSADGRSEPRDIVDIETSTPKGRIFIDKLLESNFFDRKTFSFVIRQGRSIVSDESFDELTKPLVQPITDIFEELYQFSHLTWGLAGRAFLSGCLLSYGLIRQHLLSIIAGLLFLPLLPLLLSVGFGAWNRRWRLMTHAVLSLSVSIALLVFAGVIVGAISQPPMRYNEFNSLGASFLISLAVGMAAGLSTIDDVARRELIGLAATSQVALVPTWFGACLVLGFPELTDKKEITTHFISLLVNILTLIAASVTIYIVAYRNSPALSKLSWSYGGSRYADTHPTRQNIRA